MNVQDVRFRIVRSARPVGHSRRQNRAEWPLWFADHDRREDRTDLVLRDYLQCLGAQLRREIDQIVYRRNSGNAISWRLGRIRLRGRIPFTRHVAFGYRTLLERPDRLSGDAIKSIEDSLLSRLR